MKVALLDRAVLEVQPTVKRRGETINHGALHLRANNVGVHRARPQSSTQVTLCTRILPFLDRYLRNFCHVGVKGMVRRKAQ
ncbi:MAG: hypothetical protein CM15mP74_05330 [Halieaceae bacterium]|nr:MAG: hypothetical protein CM15mP74_05330 [Halieaceae bacterium]